MTNPIMMSEREGVPMTCPRCGYVGCTVLRDRYRYVVRWYCAVCGKWIA